MSQVITQSHLLIYNLELIKVSQVEPSMGLSTSVVKGIGTDFESDFSQGDVIFLSGNTTPTGNYRHNYKYHFCNSYFGIKWVW